MTLFLSLTKCSHSQKKGTNKTSNILSNSKIIVDVREFRSSLPSLLHAAGERVFSGISRPGEGEERRGEMKIGEER